MSAQNSPLRSVVSRCLSNAIPPGSTLALFDFPNYGNVGDSAIWLGQQAYFRQNNVQICHSDDGAPRQLPTLPPDCIVAVSGGGNLGDLYPTHQKLRLRLLEHYTNHRFVQLPQSIHFQQEDNAVALSRALEQHPDTHILVRDNPSLEIAQRLHGGPTILCPDMALFLDTLPAADEPPPEPVVALLRGDKESLHAGRQLTSLPFATDWTGERKLLKKALKLATGLDRKLHPHASSQFRKNLYNYAARQRLARGCRILNRGEILITDRLHGHILASMLGKRHVVLDNHYGKIASFRSTWQTSYDQELCKSAGSLDEALTIANAWAKNLT